MLIMLRNHTLKPLRNHLEETKVNLRSVLTHLNYGIMSLVTSYFLFFPFLKKNTSTFVLQELNFRYLRYHGEPIPYRKLGFSTLPGFLESIADVVDINVKFRPTVCKLLVEKWFDTEIRSWYIFWSEIWWSLEGTCQPYLHLKL